MSYISGKVSDFESRVHQLATNTGSFASFTGEGLSYINAGIVSSQLSGKWDKETRLQRFRLSHSAADLTSFNYVPSYTIPPLPSGFPVAINSIITINPNPQVIQINLDTSYQNSEWYQNTDNTVILEYSNFFSSGPYIVVTQDNVDGVNQNSYTILLGSNEIYFRVVSSGDNITYNGNPVTGTPYLYEF